jgi:6-phosphogluconate dehydrogenase
MSKSKNWSDRLGVMGSKPGIEYRTKWFPIAVYNRTLVKTKEVL